jgi:ATP-dependent DNA helicase PIF1
MAPPGLTGEQQVVLNAVVKQRQSVFITGAAGTGKSFLLRKVVQQLRLKRTARNIFVTATTGVAALQLGGTTLHSFAGIRDAAMALDASQVHARAQARLKKCETLIVDEVSMLDEKLFDALDHLARHVRKLDKPFGGIQLVLCGDFFQLPPIAGAFCFRSKVWQEAVQQTFVLSMIHRQKDDEFIKILQEVRIGRCSEHSLQLLRATETRAAAGGNKKGGAYTRLCPRRNDCNRANSAELAKLEGPELVFEAETDGEEWAVKKLQQVCFVRSSHPKRSSDHPRPSAPALPNVLLLIRTHFVRPSTRPWTRFSLHRTSLHRSRCTCVSALA